MALPLDLFATVFLLLPGFLVIYIMRYLAVLERKLDYLEFVCWSLFASLFIDNVFILLVLKGFGLNVPLSALSNSEKNFLSLEFMLFLTALIIFSIIVGFISGLIVKYTFRKEYLRGDVWHHLSSGYKRLKKAPQVKVYTIDGTVYEGYLSCLPDETAVSKDIVIVTRNKETSEINEIVIKENSIKAICFMKPLVSNINWDERDFSLLSSNSS